MSKTIATVLVLLFMALPCLALEKAPRPNVILMMADDLAAIDLSLYGSKVIKTPNIDALAKQGLSLTNYYAGNPVCSPSRMALLSGSYPARLGWRWGVLGYGFKPKTGMSPRVYTMAEAFRDAGYRTAISGKWHLGVQNMSPEKQGFDSAYYIRMSNNQNRDMFRDGKLIKKKWDNRLLTETFAEEVVRVINEKSDKPFFMYVPWSAPHFPADAHPDWRGETKLEEYVGVVEELDHRVGQIMAALKKNGIADNTIVIFTSDNGRQSGQNKDSVGPYSGMKWHSMEGGTRVPCIIRYPKVFHPPIPRVSDQIVAAIDLYPTLASLCNVKIELPDGAQKMDGMNLAMPLMTPKGSDIPFPYRSELLYWHGKGQATAIRIGDWKLFFNAGDKGDPDVSKGPVLYNLRDDVKEITDLAAKHPEKVKQMLARAKKLLTEIYANQLPIGAWEGVEVKDKPLKAEEIWGQWIP